MSFFKNQGENNNFFLQATKNGSSSTLRPDESINFDSTSFSQNSFSPTLRFGKNINVGEQQQIVQNKNDFCSNDVETNSMYDINKYTDQELYSILDLCNPSDKELEAKIIQMINKYIRIQTEDGKSLAIFFNNIYERFFYKNKNEENKIFDEGITGDKNINFTSTSFSQNSFSHKLYSGENVNLPSQSKANWDSSMLRSEEPLKNQNIFLSINENIPSEKNGYSSTLHYEEPQKKFYGKSSQNIEGLQGNDKSDFPESQPIKIGRSLIPTSSTTENEDSTKNNKKEKTITTTKQVEYTKDYINPILKQTIKRIISVDSQYRTTSKDPLSTSFTFNLSEPLRDVLSLSLYSIHIPYTWYTISKTYGANFIYLKAKPKGLNNGDFDYKIEIDPGNYSASTLIEALNTSITNLTTTYTDVSFGTTKFSYDTQKSITSFNVDITNIYNENNYKMVFSDLTTANNFKFDVLSYDLNQYRSAVDCLTPDSNIGSEAKYTLNQNNNKIIIKRYNSIDYLTSFTSTYDEITINLEPTTEKVNALQLINIINKSFIDNDFLVNSGITWDYTRYYLTINLNRKKTINNYYYDFSISIYDDENNIDIPRIWSDNETQKSLFQFLTNKNIVNSNINTVTRTLSTEFTKTLDTYNILPGIRSNSFKPNFYDIKGTAYIKIYFQSVYYNAPFKFQTPYISEGVYTQNKYIEEINNIIYKLNETTKNLLNSDLNKNGIFLNTSPAIINENSFYFKNNMKLNIPYNYFYLNINDPTCYIGSQILLSQTYIDINCQSIFNINVFKGDISGTINSNVDFILYPNRSQTAIYPKLSSDINLNFNNIEFIMDSSTSKYKYLLGDNYIDISFSDGNITLYKKNVKINMELEVKNPLDLFFKCDYDSGSSIYVSEILQKDGLYNIKYLNTNFSPIYYSNENTNVSTNTQYNINLYFDFVPSLFNNDYILLDSNEKKYLSMSSFNGELDSFKIVISSDISFNLINPTITYDTNGYFNITSDENTIFCSSSINNIEITFLKDKKITFNKLKTQTTNEENYTYIFENDFSFLFNCNSLLYLKLTNIALANNHIIYNPSNTEFILSSEFTSNETVSIQYKSILSYDGIFDITSDLTSTVNDNLKICDTNITLNDASFNIYTNINGTLTTEWPFYKFTNNIPLISTKGNLSLNVTTSSSDILHNYLYVNVEPFMIDLEKKNIFDFNISANDIGIRENITKILSIVPKPITIFNKQINSSNILYNLSIPNSFNTYSEIDDFILNIQKLFIFYEDNDNHKTFKNVTISKSNFDFDTNIYKINLNLNVLKDIPNENFIINFIDYEFNSWNKYLNLNDLSVRSVEEDQFAVDCKEKSYLHLLDSKENVNNLSSQNFFNSVAKEKKCLKLSSLYFKNIISKFGNASFSKNINRELRNYSYKTVKENQLLGFKSREIKTDLQIEKLIIFTKDSTITFVPQNYANGLYTGDDTNNIIINIKSGSYSYYDLKNEINNEFEKNPLTFGSYLQIIEDDNKYLHYYFTININKVFTARDYNVVLYDFYSFVDCYVGYSKIKSIAADDTLGWILGFRSYISYDLNSEILNQIDSFNTINTSFFVNFLIFLEFYDFKIDKKYENEYNIGITLIADTAYTKNIYNYFLIKLDDYTQSHLNDGLVTVTNLDSSVPLPSYASATQVGCNLKTGNPEILGTTVIGMNQLTQNQIYAAQQILNNQQSRQNVLVNFSKGPYVQDIFGFIPIKTSGLTAGETIIDSSGPLQNQQRIYFGPVNIRRLTIQLLNDKGDIVDLNGANWSFSFSCEQLYQTRSI